MDDNSEDEFEENFGELDDEIVPGLEAVHEELIENGNSQELLWSKFRTLVCKNEFSMVENPRTESTAFFQKKKLPFSLSSKVLKPWAPNLIRKLLTDKLINQ